MFCGKCGKEISNDIRHCPFCGEPTSNAWSQSTSGTLIMKQKPSGKKRVVLTIGVLAFIVAVVWIIVSVVGNSGYKKTLDNYYKAIENNDADLMYSSVMANYWIDYINADYSTNYALEDIQDGIEDAIQGYDCGEKIKISYKITSEKRATKEELEELEDNIYDWYAYYVYDRDEFSITDAYLLQIRLTVIGDERSRQLNYTDGFLIIKENGKWRVPGGSIATSFYDNQ